MAFRIKKKLENAIVTSLAVALLCTSIFSWGRILNHHYDEEEPDELITETQGVPGKLKQGVLVFTGLIIMATEYLHVKKDK